jgi:tetratricopeptide (TPR) repeat protein
LGDLSKASSNLPLASQYYAESARLNPSDGLAWCRLGWVEEAQERLPSALDAFWQCCQNGDPGSNGCYSAGRVAEKLGDIPAAIRYYRLSHWSPALQRADELEGSQ